MSRNPSKADAISASVAELELLNKQLSEAERFTVTLAEELRTAESDSATKCEQCNRAVAHVTMLTNDLSQLEARLAEAPARLEKIRMDPVRIAWIKDFDTRQMIGSFFSLVPYDKTMSGLAHFIANGERKIDFARKQIVAAKAKAEAARAAHAEADGNHKRLKGAWDEAHNPRQERPNWS